MAQCKVCGLHFDDAPKLKNHKRLAHQVDVRVNYPGGVQSIQRGQDGAFACYNTLCVYTTKCPKLLQDHGKRCRLGRDEAATATEGPSVARPHASAETAGNSTTTGGMSMGAGAESPIGLVLSPQLNMLICLKCQRCIKGNSAISHILRDHGGKRPNREYLEAELSRLNAPEGMTEQAENLRKPTLELQPLVTGLPVIDGYQCSRCGKCSMSAKLCKAHQRIEHGNEHGDGDVAKIRKVRMQTFGKGIGMNFNFAVDDSTSDRGEASSLPFVAAAELATQGAMEANRMQLESPDSSRDWPPYFRYLIWPDMIMNLEQSQAKIEEQLRCPKESKHARRLWACVTPMMDRIQKCIRVSDVLVRRKVKSPGADVGPKPFSELQQSATCEDYVALLVTWVHFVLNAARGVHNFLEINDECGRVEWLRLYDHLSSCEQPNANMVDSEAAAALGVDLLHASLNKIFLRIRRHGESERDEICLRSIFMMAVGRPKVLMARNVTPLISRLLYWIRGIVLLAIQKFDAEMVPGAHEDDIAAAQNILAAEESRLRQFCSDQHKSPFCGLVQAKRILHVYSKTEPMPDRLALKDGDPKKLLVEGSTFSLDDVALMLRRLRKELAEDLEASLMLGMKCSGRIMQSERGPGRGRDMVDMLNNADQGYSFLDQRSNVCRDLRKALIHHIIKNKNLRKEFVIDFDERGHPLWQSTAVKGWYKAVGSWIRKFMVLLHLVSGQPGRGAEVVEYRYRNAQAGQRTVYISQGLAMFRPTYFKTNSESGSVKHLYRFADADTSMLLVKYLTFVRFVELMWCTETWGAESLPMYQEFIFVDRGKKITGDAFGNEVQKLFWKRLRMPVGVALWRHAAVLWGLNFCCKDGDPLKQVMHEQAGHSEETAGQVYARSADELLQVSTHLMSMFRAVSSAWHRMFGLMKYPDSSLVSPPTTPTNSHVKHQVPIPASGNGNGHDTGIPSSRACGTTYKECNLALRQGLKLMNHRGFKSPEQGEVVHRALERQHDILAILPTGGGKTLLYQLPALLEPTQIQIILCPFRALTRELMGRCTQAGLQATQWCESLSNLDGCQLLFVAMEQICSRRLQNEIANQYAIGRLSRYVIDECHVLVSSASWRPSMQDVVHLRKHPAPLLLMSGSLPPSMQKELEERLCLERLVVVRASCQRPNISYGVERSANRHQMRLRLLGWLAKARDTDGVALVFCRGREWSERLCLWLQEQGLKNVSFYHSEVIDKDREEREKGWESGEIRIMVATGAFGTGLDKRNVRVVVHFEEPYSALDLVQESGRAGRDGLKSWHRVLLANDRETGEDGDVGHNEHENLDRHEDGEKEILSQILTTKRCRRMHIERYLDGDASDCIMSGSDLCDNCQGEDEGPEREQEREAHNMERVIHDDPTEEPRPGDEPTTEESPDLECPWTQNDGAIRQHSAGRAVFRNTCSGLFAIQDIADSAILIVEFTDELTHCLICDSDRHDTRMCRGRCFLCMSSGHRRAKCPNGMIPWQCERSNPMCFKCGLPLCLGKRTLHNGNVGLNCDSKGKDHYLPWAWWTWQQRSQCEQLLREAGITDDIKDDESFRQWLGQKHPSLVTNFVRLLVLLMRKRKERDREHRHDLINGRPSI